jgi:DNA-binding NarL/FixJ family response regulator
VQAAGLTAPQRHHRPPHRAPHHDTEVRLLANLVRGEAALAPPLAWELLQFFGEPVSPPRDAAPVDDRSLDWHTHGSNPLKLSPGERRLAQLVAQGTRLPEVAASMAMSLEAIGRRVGNIYRKLSWDVRSGSLMMQAA